MNIYLGVDTGGTFTDFVLLRNNQFTTHKVLSTPHSPEQAIVTGIRQLHLDKLDETEQLFIVHGSTVATNAVLEGKGVSTTYITNRGFKDTLTLGRQARRELYNLQPEPPQPPLTEEYCLETGGRLSAHGEVLEELSKQDLINLIKQIKNIKPQAVAINLLYSYLDDRFEKQIEQALVSEFTETIFISRSSNILPEYKEYERGITTWLNAYVGPLVKGYLSRLQQALPEASISVMQSSGNTIAAEHAGSQAVHMLLSGPAGGLAAAHYIGGLSQQPQMLTFDMGGTSTDVSLIHGDIQLTSESRVAGYPVAVSMVDMHTIGAGGGSIAYIDEGGLLQVGPQSAGASPGPACYAQGGTQATVTDANLVLSRLLASSFLGGNMSLDVNAASQAIDNIAKPLGLSRLQTAEGIIKIANEHMASALRVMSVQRGIDPRELTLTSFGGAGGLHVCALADALQMKTAMVPIYSGVLSAFGMLVAAKGRELSRTMTTILTDSFNVKQSIDSELQHLIMQGEQALIGESVAKKDIVIGASLDCRYQGQSYTLNIGYDLKNAAAVGDSLEQFRQLHLKRYGHALDLPVELVNVRVGLKALPTEIALQKVTTKENAQPYTSHKIAGSEEVMHVYHREDIALQQVLDGPALITETTATTFIDEAWQCSKDVYGNLLLSRKA